jgi:NAD(P)H-nitrite reductase large subunit
MSEQAYKYIIVGGGQTGGYAVDGIREIDTDGSILLIGNEDYLPYERPDLSKKLWFDKKRIENIFVHDRGFYGKNGVDLFLGTEVVRINTVDKAVQDSSGRTCFYGKLLLATGGTPKQLPIPGGDLPGVCYYRYLDDYLMMRPSASDGKKATVIGGGFIGSELAAALNINKVDVTMVFPEPYIVQRVFPEGLGLAIQEDYSKRGVKIVSGDIPMSIEMRAGMFVVNTKNGLTLESDMLIVGVGIAPAVDLAKAIDLEIGNGIVVNNLLQTSNSDIYAAGDNAFFPYQALGQMLRVEHWDNALNQGKQAGRNMAGANEPYDYMPYFFSDLFDFGYEAVGEVDSRLETFADWQKENETGVIYYLRDDFVRGAMMCNVWDKVSDARELIKNKQKVSRDMLKGIIK